MYRAFTHPIRQQHRIIMGLVVSAVAFTAAGEIASAQAANFSCRASVLRLEIPPGSTLLEPVASNVPGSPCATDADGLPTLNAPGLLSARLLQSSTTASPNVAGARADVADVNLLLAPGVTVQAANSATSASCNTNGTASFSGSSQVVGLKIGGIPRVVLGSPNQTITLPLGLGSVVLNQEIVTPTGIVRRAVVVNTLLLRLVVSESFSGVSGCAPPPKPQCSDGIDNDGDGQTDFDPRNDPPFHPFGDQQCTSPTDNDESA
jgi:hypothetical protein